MMILVYLENILLEDDPHGTGWRLRDDVFAWLEANAGPGSRSGGWMDNADWLWTFEHVNRRRALMLFHNSKVALAFRLFIETI